MSREEEIADYTGWLEDVLIPDLHADGWDATADSFTKCVRIIDEQAAALLKAGITFK